MSLHSPRLNAGALRHRAELQHKAETADGAGGRTVAWQALRPLWCRIRPVSGVQRMESMRRDSPISHEIHARTADDIDTTKRIVYRGEAYRIEAVWPVEGRDEYLHIVASQVAVGEAAT